MSAALTPTPRSATRPSLTGPSLIGPSPTGPSAARGAQVTSVYPGGPAALAGIQPHDILLRIGSDDILDPADLRRHEAALKPGSKVELSGLRNGSPFHAEITLIQRPMMSTSSSESGN